MILYELSLLLKNWTPIRDILKISCSWDFLTFFYHCQWIFFFFFWWEKEKPKYPGENWSTRGSLSGHRREPTNSRIEFRPQWKSTSALTSASTLHFYFVFICLHFFHTDWGTRYTCIAQLWLRRLSSKLYPSDCN